MIKFFRSKVEPKPIIDYEDAPDQFIGDTLLTFLERIKTLDSSRYFENILKEKGAQETQSSCYIGNYRLLYSQQGSMVTIDWNIWDESSNGYQEIAFLQRIDATSDWYIVSSYINDELLERIEQVKCLIVAMETYEQFMDKRQKSLAGDKSGENAVSMKEKRA